MASVEKIVLENKSITATENSTAVDAAPNVDKILGFLKISDWSGLTTIDVVAQHSPNGTDWFTFQIFAQAMGNNTEAIEIDKFLFPKIRIETTVVGSGSATVLCELYCDPDK